MRLRIKKWMLGLAAGLAVSAGAGAALAQCNGGCEPPPCVEVLVLLPRESCSVLLKLARRPPPEV